MYIYIYIIIYILRGAAFVVRNVAPWMWQDKASLYGARSAQYGAEGASSAKRTRDEAVQFFSGARFSK